MMRRRRISLTVFAAAVLLIIVLVVLFGPGNWTLSLELKGKPEITVEQDEKYEDAGAEAVRTNKTFKNMKKDVRVKKRGKVDVIKEGTYKITYTAKYHSQKAEKKRTVTVKDMKPVITLNGGKNFTVYDTIGFKDSYYASDIFGNDITSRVQVTGDLDTTKPGKYKLTYSVTDYKGRTGTAVRNITVKKFPKPKPSREKNGQKVIYLTFDDGPYKYTDQLLDILACHKVKATFFVTNAYPEYAYCIKKEYDAGHAIGIHTYSHTYSSIYASDQAFWDDFNQMEDVVRQQTGHKTKIMRFPGGGSNTVSAKYCYGLMTRLANECTAKGYWYFDWNVLSGDAGDTKDSAQILARMERGVQKNEKSIILCHDIHPYTVNAIDSFLTWAQCCGYKFDTLKDGGFAAHQRINN